MTDSEIDRLVAEKVMGWHLDPSHPVTDPLNSGPAWRRADGSHTYHYLNDLRFAPSTDLNAAVEAALTRPCDNWSALTIQNAGRGWTAGWWMHGGGHGEPPSGWALKVSAPTPARALCLALLKAVGALPAGNEGGAL